jgi:hypothetical protein
LDLLSEPRLVGLTLTPKIRPLTEVAAETLRALGGPFSSCANYQRRAEIAEPEGRDDA